MYASNLLMDGIFVLVIVYLALTTDAASVAKTPEESPGVVGEKTDGMRLRYDVLDKVNLTRSTQETTASNAEGGDSNAVIINRNHMPEELNVLNPFLGFPFFPFPFPNIKREAPRMNFTGKPVPVDGKERSTENGSKSEGKPFIFIDFAFNVQEVPLINKTLEKSNSLDDGAIGSPHNEFGLFQKNINNHKRFPFDILEDDRAFPRDPLLLPPLLDGFLPKPDFFFDFPLNHERNIKDERNKRNIGGKPNIKSDINFIMDIFDKVISRANREMEQSVPFLEFMNDFGHEDMPSTGLDKRTSFYKYPRIEIKKSLHQEPKGFRLEKRDPAAGKLGNFQPLHQKGPMVLGKVIEIGEIHFGDRHPKNKKHRRNSSLSAKKGHRNMRGASIVPINPNDSGSKVNRDNFPFGLGLKDFLRNIHDRSIKKQENVSETLHQKRNTSTEVSEGVNFEAKLGSVNKKTLDPEGGSKETEREGEGFKYVGHLPTVRDSTKDSVGFEVLDRRSSVRRFTGQDGMTVAIAKNVTKENLKKNISQVLFKFFSRTNKLKDPKVSDQDKEVQGLDNLSLTYLDEIHKTGSDSKDAVERPRRDGEHRTIGKDYPVANLTELFLTVTLPTILGFILLLVVCFVTMRVRGWFCTRLFRPRNLYVVESDTEVVQHKKEKKPTKKIDKADKMLDKKADKKTDKRKTEDAEAGTNQLKT